MQQGILVIRVALLLPQVDLRHINQRRGTNRIEMGIDLQEYYLSTEWDIMTAPAVRNEKYYPCCEEPYPVSNSTATRSHALSLI